MNICMLIVFAGLFSTVDYPAVNPQPQGKATKSDPQLQISIHPFMPFKHKRPAIIVRYHNAGKKPISLTLPYVGYSELAGGNVDETWWFPELSVEIDGLFKAEFRHKKPKGDLLWSRDAIIAPGKHVDLELQLSDIYKIPENWITIDIKTSMISGIEAKVIGNLELRRMQHALLAQIYVTAKPVLPMNCNDPQIVVRFHNFGKVTYKLPLPYVGSETMIFTSVSATIDRIKIKSPLRVNGLIADSKDWTRFEDLEPGKATQIKIRLKDFYKLPNDWKLIEIEADQFYLPIKSKKKDERFMYPE